MEGRFQKFLESRQAVVKLQIASEDYFLPDLPPAPRKAYEEYLRLRLRPAAEWLVRAEDPERLQKLWELQCFSEAMVNDLLSLSLAEHKNVSYVWLLRKKQETWGFPSRDFSL